jgi:hypothetical protein
MILEFDIDRYYRWFIPSIIIRRQGCKVDLVGGWGACRVIQNGAWFIKGKSITGSPLGNPDPTILRVAQLNKAQNEPGPLLI